MAPVWNATKATASIAHTAYGPTPLASTGTMTRNPLPKMEASGVLMAGTICNVETEGRPAAQPCMRLSCLCLMIPRPKYDKPCNG